MAKEFPISYKDTLYSQLDASTEAELGLPTGLLASLRSNGERSNHDQTNSNKTATVYQFIPATQEAILKKYGIDVTLSPENASKGAGLLLQESLKRNQNKPDQAVGEYIGGINRENWGSQTKAYINRVMVGLNKTNTTALESDFKKFMSANPAVPAGRSLTATEPPKQAEQQPPNQLESDFAAFMAKAEKEVPPAPEPGVLARIKDVVTGGLRQTEETRTLPEWTSMPELNQLSMASMKSGVGTMFAPSAEIPAILKAQYPNMEVRQDAKGNNIFKSPSDGKEYALTPGLTWGDIPRVIGGIAAFTPAGRAATLPMQVGGAAATQAAIETSQAVTGGEFNPAEVAIAGAAAPVAALVAKGVGGAVQGVKNVLQKSGMGSGKPVQPVAPAAVQAVPETAPVVESPSVPEPPIAPVETNAVWKGGDADIPVVFKSMESAPGPDGRMYAKVEANGKTTYVPADELVYPAAKPDAPVNSAAVTPKPIEELADLAQKATQSTFGKKKATEELALQAAPNKAVVESAERLKMELDPEFVTDNEQYRRLVGLMASQAGSTAETRSISVVRNAADRAEEAMTALGASKDMATLSDKVKSGLAATRDELEKASDALYKEIDDAVPKSTPVELPALKAHLDGLMTDMGGIKGLFAQEKSLAAMLKEPVTYGRMAVERGLIGQALAGKESTYGNMLEGRLKQLYKALASDQLDSVTSIGGDVLRDKYRLASQTVAKRKGLEKRIVETFGRDGNGSLVSSLRNALNASVRGDDKGLTKILRTVPPELQKETMSAALLNYASSTTKSGQFGFAQYEKMYRGMRNNSPVYNAVVKSLGPNADEVLTDLYQVSRAIAKAQDALISTGRANSLILKNMQGAETLVGKVLEGAKTAAVRGAAMEGATAMAIGPTGAGFMAGALQAATSPRKDVAKAIGELLTSPEFKDVIQQVVKRGDAPPHAVTRLAKAKAMRGYGQHMSETFRRDITEREAWINSALQSSRSRDKEQSKL